MPQVRIVGLGCMNDETCDVTGGMGTGYIESPDGDMVACDLKILGVGQLGSTAEMPQDLYDRWMAKYKRPIELETVGPIDLEAIYGPAARKASDFMMQGSEVVHGYTKTDLLTRLVELINDTELEGTAIEQIADFIFQQCGGNANRFEYLGDDLFDFSP